MLITELMVEGEKLPGTFARDFKLIEFAFGNLRSGSTAKVFTIWLSCFLILCVVLDQSISIVCWKGLVLGEQLSSAVAIYLQFLGRIHFM